MASEHKTNAGTPYKQEIFPNLFGFIIVLEYIENAAVTTNRLLKYLVRHLP